MPISWSALSKTEPGAFELSSFTLSDDPWADAERFDLRKAIELADQVVADQGIKLPDFDRFGRDLEKDKQ